MKAFPLLTILLIFLSPLTFAQKVHKVKSGEHLNMIAEKYGTTAKVLQKYNGISNANLLKVGQSLRIPLEGSTVDNIKTPPRPEYHTVKKGDTFYGICNKYGLAVKEVEKLNPKVNPSKIDVGQKIKIPGGKAGATVPQVKNTPEKKEETPKTTEIAKKETAPPVKNEGTPAPVVQEKKPSFTKVVVTQKISLGDFAKKYQMTIPQVNDVNGWNYDENTVFDEGSVAYVYQK